jgi:hypothetical protein
VQVRKVLFWSISTAYGLIYAEANSQTTCHGFKRQHRDDSTLGALENYSISADRACHPIRLAKGRAGSGAIRKGCRKMTADLVSINGQDVPIVAYRGKWVSEQ